MQGKYSYVQTRDIPVLHLELIMISAIGGSCPRANLDERGDLIEADVADTRKRWRMHRKGVEKSIRLSDCGGALLLFYFFGSFLLG